MYKLTVKTCKSNIPFYVELTSVMCKSESDVFDYIKTYIKSLQGKIGTDYSSVSNNKPAIIDRKKIYCSATAYINGNTPCENYNFYAEKIN